MKVCARFVFDCVHLQTVCRPVIAPDAVTKHVQSQTCVCGLRNRGCNSKTQCCCKRQCPWMISLFAVYVKWHLVWLWSQTQKSGRENIQKETWAYQMDGISTLALLAVVVLWQNMKEHGSNLHELISDKRGAMFVTWRKTNGTTKSSSSTKCHHGLRHVMVMQSPYWTKHEVL